MSLALMVASPAQAEVPQIDGNLWKDSTTAQKQAYLIGVANVLSVNRAIQVKKGTVDESAALNRYSRAADAQSIEALQARLDSWYSANPDKLDTPVLGVIWLGVVKASGM